MSAGQDTRLSALDSVLDQASSQGGSQGESLADGLFAVVDLLDAQPSLRRALTDPSTPESARQQIVRQLLDGKVDPAAVTVVAEASAIRWPGARTFVAALERQAIRAALANAGDSLDEVEDQLFRFARVVESDGGLRSALSDRTVPLAHRQTLVSELLNGKVVPTTVRLATRAVAARERTFDNTIEGYVNLAAAMRNRAVATVRVARPLSQEQFERLRAALTRQTGRDISLQMIVDPSVLGGVRVELGDEVIEGTVAGRLEDARRLFG